LLILKPLLDFFKAEKTVYSHRDRSIEIIAQENHIDIDSIKHDVIAILQQDGRVEATIYLRKRFHVPLSVAWRFVDKLEAGLSEQDR